MPSFSLLSWKSVIIFYVLDPEVGPNFLSRGIVWTVPFAEHIEIVKSPIRTRMTFRLIILLESIVIIILRVIQDSISQMEIKKLIYCFVLLILANANTNCTQSTQEVGNQSDGFDQHSNYEMLKNVPDAHYEDYEARLIELCGTNQYVSGVSILLDSSGDMTTHPDIWHIELNTIGMIANDCKEMMVPPGELVELIEVIVSDTHLSGIKVTTSEGETLQVGNVDTHLNSEMKTSFHFTRNSQLIGAFGKTNPIDNTKLTSIGFIENVCYGGMFKGVTLGEVLKIIVIVLFWCFVIPATVILGYCCLSNRGQLCKKLGRQPREVELPDVKPGDKEEEQEGNNDNN